mgnify:CR=1 FL=1|tara:strand:+ start:435 stop:656 length:222 start_codon:yes stop_codon:yes gene_type:complete
MFQIIGITLLSFSSIIGINYGFYKLGMWSVRKRLIETRKLLLKQHPQDEILIEEISNHIVEIDMFNKSKLKSK